jgi:two-component system cell cycle response regulator
MNASETAAEAPMRILVVDDDPETVRLLRSWFKDQAYEIQDAADADAGLRLAVRSRPDIILLDIRMPGMDGLATTRHLKTDPTTRAIPVILLTACREVEAKVEAFAAGADDYVTKPFEFEEVDARIRAMLRKRELYIKLEGTVADLQATNKQLEELLVMDEKTGLYNYRQFRQKLTEEWLRAERYGTPLSLIMMDLDNFKRLNDTLGHLAGDRALKEFATLVAGGARATDMAARYGGEEFAIVLPHTSGDMACRVAERIRQATKQFVFLEDERPTRMTVSAGVATFPSSAGIRSADALIQAADRALYDAKQTGKDRVVEAGEMSTRSMRTPEERDERAASGRRRPSSKPPKTRRKTSPATPTAEG